MAYLGNTPEQQAFTPAVDYFSGNGSTTAFTLSRPVASVAQVQVTVENVPQNPGTAYTVSGNTITFDGAPPSGTNNIYVYYTSPITQVIQPGQGTVGTAQIQNGAVIPADLSIGAPFWDTSGNVGIGTSSPSVRLQVSGEAIFGGAGAYQTVYANNNSATGGGAFTVQQNGTSRGGVAVSGAWLGDTSSDLAVFSVAPNIRFYNNNSSTERMRIASDGNLQFNSGYGSVATAYGCRAWVNFNGSNGSIRASGGVSSITRRAGGCYSFNFAAAMPDANYAVQVTTSATQGVSWGGTPQLFHDAPDSQTAPTSSSFIFLTSPSGGNDRPWVCVSVHR